MRKLNKIIKKYTINKQRRRKVNIAVFTYLSDVLDFIGDDYELRLAKIYFSKMRDIVFLEKYFEAEMIKKEVNIVEYLFNYFDYDLFSLTKEKVKVMHLELTHPDEFSRNRIKLVSLRIPIIGKILSEYRGV
jgi:hypothetical protein